MLIQSENCLGTPCSTLRVPSPQDCHAFWLVPMCTVYQVVKSTSPEACHHRVRLLPLATHVTIIGIPGWAPAEYDMCGPNCGLHSTLVATRVIKCGYGKEGEQRYALVPRGLASWIEMVPWTWQATDLTLINGARIIGVLHIVNPCTLYRLS